MADTNIVKGLFGITPDELIAQRDQAQQARAMQFAQIAPEAQSSYLGYRAGTNIGTGLAGLMGAQDPELMRVTKLNSLLKDIDPTSAEGLAKAATVLAQNGFQQEAMQAAAKAQEMKQAQLISAGTQAKTAADMARAERETAMAERALADAKKLSKEEGFKNLPPEVQTILLMEQRDPEFDAKKAMQDYLNKKGNAQWSEPYQLGGATVQRNAQTGEIRTAVSRPPVTTVNTGTGANKPLSTKDIEAVNKLRSSVNVASTNVTKADEFISGLEKGVAKFGAGSNAASNLRTLFGSSTEGDRFKQNVERYTVAAVNAVLNMAKGPQTDQDAERARNQIMTGLQKNDTNAVIEGLRELRRIHNEIKTNDSESLDLFGTERKRDFGTKKSSEANQPQTRKTKSGVTYTVEN